MNHHTRITILLSALALSIQSFAQSTDAYRASIDSWHRARTENLKKENGWLNLAGLFWLQEGSNSFGSDSTQAVVFPKGSIPAHAGYFVRKGNTVSLLTQPGVRITIQDTVVTDRIIFQPDSIRTPVLAYGSLRWSVIKREDRIGIRLRDLKSKELEHFKGIDRYPVNAVWRTTAKLETSGQPGRISITNVLGQTNLQNAAGKLVFTLRGKTYTLDVLDEGEEELFIVFADATNATGTYPSGRFLYIPRPDAQGNTVIDFNKAYNPPCAFTPFATCPLPPPQNRLSLAITAGEKNYGKHGTGR